MNPFGLPNFQIPITINGITNKVWYFYWAKIGQTLANQVALPSGSYTNTNLTVNANGVISAISSGAGGGVVTSIGSSTLTIGGTASVPTVDLSGAQLTDLALAATSLQPNGVSGTITNANLTIVNGQITVAASGSGGSSLSLTDGTHTVSPTTAITASGLTVGGSTPNATLTYNLSDGSTTPIYTVANTLGAWTTTLKTQSANTVFAGPTTGAAAQPTFRSLVAADGPIAGFGTVATTLTQAGGASQTYNVPVGSKLIRVYCIGGGGGGGSACGSNNTTQTAGGGGGGGGISIQDFLASDLGSSVTVTFSNASTGGAGGVGSVGNTNGTSGTAGSNVAFGTFLQAFGGALGTHGTAGGSGGPGGTGGLGSYQSGTSGGAGATSGTGTNGGNLTATFGQATLFGCTGGGGGGSGNGNVNSSFPGGNGGGSAPEFNTWTAAAGGVANNLGNGGPGSIVTISNLGMGAGGGGGGCSGLGTTGHVGGAGGSPTNYGGGGGGGGAIFSAVGVSNTGGNGGNGGPAACIIIAY